MLFLRYAYLFKFSATLIVIFILRFLLTKQLFKRLKLFAGYWAKSGVDRNRWFNIFWCS